MQASSRKSFQAKNDVCKNERKSSKHIELQIFRIDDRNIIYAKGSVPDKAGFIVKVRVTLARKERE